MKDSSIFQKNSGYKFSTSIDDLRAPSYVRVRKGLWQLRLLTLISIDFILLFTACVIAQRHSLYVEALWNKPGIDVPKLVFVPLVFVEIITLFLQGTYQAGKKRYDYFRIITALTLAHGLILLVGFLYLPVVDIPRSSFIVSWLMSIVLVCTGRMIVNLHLASIRRKSLASNHTYIICDSENSEKIFELLEQEKRYIIHGTASAKSLDRANRQQTIETLNKLGVSEVFIAWDAIKNRLFLYWLFQTYGITIHILPMELKPIYRHLTLNKVGGMPCLSFDCPAITGKDFWIKKSFDFFATILFLMFFFPVYLAIALAIKLDSPGPVFYKQIRVGLHGKEFKVWKFRTMRTDADKLQKELEALNETKDGILFKIKDDPRVTRIGKFLRRYSLDELPQLFNVLLGEMSLVGPRPLPKRDVDKFLEHHFIRQEVLPGVTGLWQVSGRSDILDFEQVINLDVKYIENWSLQLDFEILIRTVMVVLKKEGAY
ncbi:MULTISPECIES: sugar transferase [Calothrix]|uniref:Sugar transferase n=2 Tax=Calothrix TaxID=1186 RepID=A0ABR8ABW5_9CYAN|nr:MULTISPECIES: sugar transferase [Calothrix]MBD2197368.1 sugar transferase [Calothrix parietina FACHB-288]MBD2228174.1 sugar transferase [Calothrix anomala FACHB-343]